MATVARNFMGLLRKIKSLLRASRSRARPAQSESAFRVFAACPDFSPPSGGIRQIYRLVDDLRLTLGIDARVLHQRSPFRCTWFEHATPISYEEDTEISPNDLIIYPETVTTAIATLYPGVSKIILNQSACYAFTFPENRHQVPDFIVPLPFEFLGFLCVSAYNLALTAHAFPGKRAARLRPVINQDRFHARDLKRPQIAYMPRRNAEESRYVLGALAQRGALTGFTVVPLDNLSEIETARVLRESSIFLSFGSLEGFGLPPAEAMACGCMTIGYHGMGGQEFFLPSHSWPIEAGHLLEYVQTVENVLAQYRLDPAPLLARAQAAARFIAAEYSPDLCRTTLQMAWNQLTANTRYAR